MDACVGKPFGEPGGHVLRSPIRMVDNIIEVGYTVLLAAPDGVIDRVEDYRGGNRRRDSPAQDPHRGSGRADSLRVGTLTKK